tara:strand:- start:1249 stop:1896 length:648 start_codon:yes stop_codon:yes gene_type:complete
MSFTYAQMKTAIQDFCENTETSFVTNLPVFIRAAEDRIFQSVNLTYFKKNASSALSTGDEFLSVPTDFLTPFSLHITTANFQDFLTLKDVNFVQKYTLDSASTGTPQYYGIYDVDNLIVSPTPDQNYTVELHYYYRPASLTAGADSGQTWISENAPNVLLYGALYEAYTYMKGEQDVLANYEKRFVENLSRLKDLAEAREEQDAFRVGNPTRPRT